MSQKNQMDVRAQLGKWVVGTIADDSNHSDRVEDSIVVGSQPQPLRDKGDNHQTCVDICGQVRELKKELKKRCANDGHRLRLIRNPKDRDEFRVECSCKKKSFRVDCADEEIDICLEAFDSLRRDLDAVMKLLSIPTDT